MVLIKFVRKGVQYTWLINENWVPIIVFLIILLGGITVKLLRWKNKKITTKILPPRGGTDISDCFDPGKSYEVVDDATKLVIKQNFDEPAMAAIHGREPVIINTVVFLYSYIMANQPIRKAIFSGIESGIEIYITNIKSVLVKSGGAAVVAGGLLTYLGTTLSVSVFASVIAAIAIGIVGSDQLNCNDFVRELEQTSIQKILPAQTAERGVFLDETQALSRNRVFIVDNEETETKIFVTQETDYKDCYEELTDVYVEVENLNPTIPWYKKYEKTEAVQRKCHSNKKYVPLKARTKTLSDLKKDDVSKRKEIAYKYLEQSEKKRIKNKIDD